SLTYTKVLNDDLRVLDASAVAICRDNAIPIVVYNMNETGSLEMVLRGDGTAALVHGEA
ncbi:MAG: UMP kinase, partial [Sphingomonadales bacterium]